MKQLHQFDEVFDAQEVFRLVLEAMANPTRTLSVKKQADKLYGNAPWFLALAMTLLDQEVSFSACGNEALAEQIELLTHAKEVPEEEADFLFVTDETELSSVVEQVKCGTLENPHKSATILLAVPERSDTVLTLSGPGICEQLQWNTSFLAEKALRLRDAQEYEYPQGIDYIFVTGAGEISCIPRLVKMEQ